MSDYYIEPFVDTGLGNSVYIVGSHESNKGLFIDPLKDFDQYLAAAYRLGILDINHSLCTILQ